VHLPFTREAFFAVFAAYNAAAWPAQLLLYVLALAATALAVRDTRRAAAETGGVLALLWAWAAVVYHGLSFSRLDPAAWTFAAAFLAQAALLGWAAVVRDGLRFGRPRGWRGWVGGTLVGYALLLYPLVGLVAGHPLGELPVIGVPCPTTIFTLGILCWARPLPRYLLVVPLVWSVIGGSAAFTLGVPQDLGLLAAGAAGLALLLSPAKPST
jgi:hypothetical protein